jgi:hypothetical protein
MIWSALSLAASLLLCAAVVLGPLATGNVDSRSPGLSQSAQAIELRTKGLESVAGVGETLHRLKLREDASVIKVSAGSR